MKRALLVVVLLVAACSEGDDDDKAAATTTTATSPSTSSTTATVEGDAESGLCFAFEEIDRGASVTVVSVSDCDGNPLRIAGEPAAFPIGGTVTHAEGIRCEPNHLVVLSAVSDDGETYQAVEKTYAVEGDELVLTGETGSTVDAEDAQPFYELDCPTS